MDLLAHDCMGSLQSVLYLIYVYVQPIQIVHFVVGYHYNRALWNSGLSFEMEAGLYTVTFLSLDK